MTVTVPLVKASISATSEEEGAISVMVIVSFPKPLIVPDVLAAYTDFISATEPLIVTAPESVMTPVVFPFRLTKSEAKIVPVSDNVTASLPKPVIVPAVFAS